MKSMTHTANWGLVITVPWSPARILSCALGIAEARISGRSANGSASPARTRGGGGDAVQRMAVPWIAWAWAPGPPGLRPRFSVGAERGGGRDLDGRWIVGDRRGGEGVRWEHPPVDRAEFDDAGAHSNDGQPADPLVGGGGEQGHDRAHREAEEVDLWKGHGVDQLDQVAGHPGLPVSAGLER
jgi:hypothetical protein